MMKPMRQAGVIMSGCLVCVRFSRKCESGPERELNRTHAWKVCALVWEKTAVKPSTTDR